MDNKNTLEQIRQGNKQVIQEVYKKYAVDVYKFSKNITKDHDLAMEATEQTFLDLFARIRKGESPEDIRREALKTTYEKAQELVAAKAQAEAELEPAPEQVSAASQEEPAAAPVSEEQKAPQGEPAAPQEEAAVEKVPVAAEEPVQEPEEEILIPVTDEPAPQKSGVYEDDTVQIQIPEPEEEPGPADQLFSTQVIDISEAPEEGDRILKEAVPDDDYSGYEDEDEDEEEGRSHKVLFVILVVLNVVLILLLLWLLIGLLVNLEVLPSTMDLGYTWFNNTFYPIF